MLLSVAHVGYLQHIGIEAARLKPWVPLKCIYLCVCVCVCVSGGGYSEVIQLYICIYIEKKKFIENNTHTFH